MHRISEGVLALTYILAKFVHNPNLTDLLNIIEVFVWTSQWLILFLALLLGLALVF